MKLSLFRFWRKSIPDLLKENLLLRAKLDTAREFYNMIPINERKNRFEAFRKWLELFVEANRYMIKVVNRFSPEVAREFKAEIIAYSKRAEELLKEEHWESKKLAIFTEKQLNELIKEMLDDSMKYADIHQKEVNMAFIVLVDTLRRIKGELPLEPVDQVKRTLAECDPKLAKMYEGVFRVLESDNPERYRHCSVTMREILDGILGKTSEARSEVIRTHVSSNRESEILKSLDKLVRSIDQAWNKGVHEEIRYETATLAIQATELIMSYVFH